MLAQEWLADRLLPPVECIRFELKVLLLPLRDVFLPNKFFYAGNWSFRESTFFPKV